MMIDSHTGRPQIVTPMPMRIPAKPTIEPIDRSNSPAIMSRATAVADDADLGRHVEVVERPGRPMKAVLPSRQR